MQKKLLRLIFLLLGTILLFFCVSCKSQEPNDTSTGETPSFEEKTAAQKRAVNANEALIQYFYSNGWAGDNKPDYFGGTYIEDNILHVRLVNPSLQTMDTLKAVFSGYQDVVAYEDATYSMAVLLEYRDKLIMALLEEGCGVTSGDVSSKTGDICIEVIEEDVDRAKQLIEGLQKKLWEKDPPRVDVIKGYPIQLD